MCLDWVKLLPMNSVIIATRDDALWAAAITLPQKPRVHASACIWDRFPVSSFFIRFPHDSIVEGGGKWDVMRCQLSSVKCCCLHLSHDASSPGFVFSISHLQIFNILTRYPLKSLSDLNSLSSYLCGHLFLSNISSDWSFGCSASCLTLQDVIELHAKRQRSCSSAYVTFTSSKSFPPISPLFFFFFNHFSRPRRLSSSHHGPQGRMARAEAGH